MAEELVKRTIQMTRLATTATVSTAVSSLSSSGDIEITDSTDGLILKSANGTRWRVKADNDGNLTLTSL